MRFAVVCLVWSSWASIAAAQQVTLLRHDVADEQVAQALEQLIGAPVAVVEAAQGGGPRVSIDRSRAVIQVVSEDDAELSRTLDPIVLAKSPYAVALAVAELLELSKLPRSRSPRSAEVSRADYVAPHGESSSVFAAAAAPVARVAVVEAPQQAPASASAPREDHADTQLAALGTPSLPREAARSESRVVAEAVPGEPVGHASVANAGRGSLRSSFALGVDLDFQTQPGHALSFVRPGIYAELAWGRGGSGAFWGLGVRATAPFGRELQPTAADTTGAAMVRARAMDAAFQGSAGYTFGRLGLAAHVVSGISYLRVETLGQHDTAFTPLFGAGAGVRLSLAYGFALAVRGEAQWAGPGASYQVSRAEVLESGAFRVGLLTGVLWESALGGGAP